MIRTRDLVVFLCLLFFVLLGIVFTLLGDTHRREAISFFTFEDAGVEEDYAAQGDVQMLDRESIITRLRNALTQTQSDVDISPSVEESEESVSEEDAVVVTPGVIYCPTYDDSENVVRNWPFSGVQLSVEGGWRIVAEATPEPFAPTPSATSSSSTSSQTQTRAEDNSKTLLKLPAYPIASGEACVPGEVVGVTQSGALIYNSEVALYRGYGGEYLIGYARDGFPIYGYYQGEVDACGGYMHPSGYRYSITPDRTYVLGCFKGSPASFIGF